MTQEAREYNIFAAEDDIYSRLRTILKAIAWDGKVPGWRIVRCGVRTIKDLFKLRKVTRLYMKEETNATH